MRLNAVQNISAIALLAAVAVLPFSEAHAQSSNASERGQEMGQGTPGGSNPNAGPGNNSGQGNASPGSTGAAMSGNDNAGPGNNSGSGSTQTAGPESGHTCGGLGHIDNDAPGHQHDDCDPVATGSTGGGAPAANAAAGGAQTPGGATPAGGGAQAPRGATPAGGGAVGVGTTADCSLTGNLTPLFGDLTQREANVLATTDEAALVPVPCPEVPSDPEAQQAVSANPDLVQALEAQGYDVQQVIAAEVDGSVPTIYVEEPSTD